MKSSMLKIRDGLTDTKVVAPAFGILLFLLGLWGCLTVFSATSYGENPFFYSGRQFLWLMISMFIFWKASQIRFDLYFRNAHLAAFVFYIPLVLVLFKGVSVNGMRGWFDIGLFYIQPSEIAKPFYVMLLCHLNANNSGRRRLVLMFGALVAWLVPIALEPDWGTAFIYIAGFILVFMIGGGRIAFILAGIMVVIIAGYVAISTEPYIMRRVSGFLDPSADPGGAGWHILQFKYAIARGGVDGVGLGKSLWSNTFLPLAYSDSSFAALAESVGLIGTFPVIAGFIIFFFSSFHLSTRDIAEERKLFIVSMISMIVFQAFIHISVNLGLMPPTGVTLPLLSYGGSSLFSTMIAAGMIISAANTETFETKIKYLRT